MLKPSVFSVTASSDVTRLTEPVVSHTLSVPGDSTEPAPLGLAQRAVHVHAAACRGRQRVSHCHTIPDMYDATPVPYHFSPREPNTLGRAGSTRR